MAKVQIVHISRMEDHEHVEGNHWLAVLHLNKDRWVVEEGEYKEVFFWKKHEHCIDWPRWANS